MKQDFMAVQNLEHFDNRKQNASFVKSTRNNTLIHRDVIVFINKYTLL